MLGEGGSYFGKDDLFCLLRNYLPDMATARNAFLFSWRRADRLMGRPYTYTIKSRLAASFGGVTDRERKRLGKKASGYEIPGQRTGQAFLGRLAFGPSSFGVPGQRTGRASLGRLAYGPNPFGVLGRRTGRASLGRLASGPNPFRALGLGRLAKGAWHGPMVPTMPPFSYRGRRLSPVGKKKKKKKTSLTVIL